ncbi:MAG: alpha/beta hydrolase [Proteobacteria bacterium]|nr:alpha/beta hydrolase [Pseudomonadota bacterium]
MSNKKTMTVLIHGIWMPAIIMWPMALMLRRAGFDCRLFGYPTLTHTLTKNAARLNRFIVSLHADEVHLVAHSLGGLLVRALLKEYPDQPPGRVVMLGTPNGGSVVGERLRSWGSPGRWLAGRSLLQHLDEGSSWPVIPREMGVIAGSWAFGVGTFLGGLSGPGDGAVLIEETRCPDMVDHLVLPLTHTALMTAPSAAKATAHFLKAGHF